MRVITSHNTNDSPRLAISKLNVLVTREFLEVNLTTECLKLRPTNITHYTLTVTISPTIQFWGG
ncbi:hypothetical protein FRX31_018414 [Thalictrum thalictroides]|uniref:Uncharacterized protein n=1 Tax=Thalictrum thalictroides TaxID=46969 RepID=A0A7J6W4W3_THATH|nr:hypothetical protein FRX31_018414 [Thalictrum thalictroides]